MMKITRTDWEGLYETVCGSLCSRCLGIRCICAVQQQRSCIAINKFQVSQINVGELMSNASGLIDTTPAEPFHRVWGMEGAAQLRHPASF
jgi:hypothetical protein